MTVYIALNAARKKEVVNLLACPDKNDLTTGENVLAVVDCNRVLKDDIVDVEYLPLDRTSYYSYVLNITLKVVRVVEKE